MTNESRDQRPSAPSARPEQDRDRNVNPEDTARWLHDALLSARIDLRDREGREKLTTLLIYLSTEREDETKRLANRTRGIAAILGAVVAVVGGLVTFMVEKWIK